MAALFVVLGRTASAAEPVAAWTGYYVGLNGGYGWSRDEAFMFETSALGLFYYPFSTKSTSSPAYGMSGGSVGGQIGYNYQFAPQWLTGLEADIQASWIGGHGNSNLKTSFSHPAFHLSDFIASAGTELRWFGTVRARAGYLPSNNILIYATGGLAFGEVKRTGSIFDTFTGSLSATSAGQVQTLNCTGLTDCYAGSDTRTEIGWTVGAGAEMAVWSNVTLKAEYLHLEFDGKHTVLQATRAPFQVHFNADFGHTRHDIVRLGLNYRFPATSPVR